MGAGNLETRDMNRITHKGNDVFLGPALKITVATTKSFS